MVRLVLGVMAVFVVLFAIRVLLFRLRRR